MNRKLLMMLAGALCLGACLCKYNTAVTPEIIPVPAEAAPEAQPAPDLTVFSAPGEISAPAEPAPVTTAPKSTARPQAKPAAQKVAKDAAGRQHTAAANATPAVVVSAPQPAVLPDAPQPQDDSAVFDTDKAAALITQKRSAQTLSAPVSDTAVFDDEKLISLDGRRLGPLAYEPLLPDTSSAQWRGEQLKFGVYYSFIKAGTAYIKNRGLTQVNGRTAFLIQTTAFSATVIDAVFRVRDVNYSWIDAQTFKSLGYTQSLREGNYVRDEWLTFDIANKRYYGEVQKKQEPRVIAGELTEEVLDMLSSLYYVRTQPLETGKDIVFDIINRETQYPLVVKVLKQETVKTSAGKFNCWLVEPKFRGEGIFVAKGKSLKVWLTADEYKMPVKMEAEVFIGSVKAELLEYKRN